MLRASFHLAINHHCDIPLVVLSVASDKSDTHATVTAGQIVTSLRSWEIADLMMMIPCNLNQVISFDSHGLAVLPGSSWVRVWVRVTWVIMALVDMAMLVAVKPLFLSRLQRPSLLEQ